MLLYVQGQSCQTIDNIWYIDSGCSRHMTDNLSLLSNVKFVNGGHVKFAGNTGGYITKEGVLSNDKISFEHVSFVEQLKHNLLSVSQVCDKDYPVFFDKKACYILKPGVVIPEDWIVVKAPRKSNTYQLDMNSVTSNLSNTCLFTKASEKDSISWHRRMGHVNFQKKNFLIRNDLVEGVPFQSFCISDCFNP